MRLATRSAMASDGDLLDAVQRIQIEALLSNVDAQAASGDAAGIDAAVEALARGTETFAAARMNRGIRAALAGRRVEEV